MDFIKQHSDMDAQALAEEFRDIDLGNVTKRIALKSEVKDKHLGKYFRESVFLKSEDEVLISREWGAHSEWKDFTDKMTKYGYIIGQCVIFNIGEGNTRSWKYCYDYNFISAGGDKGYHTQMKKLKTNDIVFAYCVENTPEDQRGCVAYGKIISEAVDVNEFKTPKHKMLAECETDGGIPYRERFAQAFTREYPDYAVGIEWLPPSPISSPVKLSAPPRTGGIERIKTEDFNKLMQAFNLTNNSE